MTELLHHLQVLTHAIDRRAAAQQLARFLHADDLLIFVPDHQLSILLPGPGFVQSLSNGKAWRQFLTRHAEDVYRDTISYPTQATATTALAVRATDGAVGVLLGGNPGSSDSETLKQVVSILSPLLKKELLLIATQSKAQQNVLSAEKAERLAQTLEEVRHHLVEALATNTHLLQTIHQQNSQLKTANEELAVANEEIVATNQQLSLTNARLLKVNAELDNFIYAASHDLRAPISNIEGLINALVDLFEKQHFQDPTTLQIVAKMKICVQRFTDTIGSLTEVIKLQDAPEGDMVEINLREILQDVKLDLSQLIKDTNAHIHTQLDNFPSFRFSRKNLKSILYNLLSNAIKYHAPNRPPYVTVSCQRQAEYFLLKVQDNGLGLAPEAQTKVFTLFKRIHSHVEGSGVGLYLVKKMVENAEGKVELESQVGVGSTFSVYLRA